MCLQIRMSSIAVAGVELVLPTCVLDDLDCLTAKWAAADAAPTDPSPHPKANPDSGPSAAPPTPASSSLSDAPLPRDEAPGDPLCSAAPGEQTRVEGGHEQGQGGCAAVQCMPALPGGLVVDGGGSNAAEAQVQAEVQPAGTMGALPEGHSVAAVHAALEEDRTVVRMRTAEGVAAAAAAYGGLRGALGRCLLTAQSVLVAGAAAAEERAPVLRRLRDAVAVGRGALEGQRAQYESDSRCAVCCVMMLPSRRCVDCFGWRC